MRQITLICAAGMSTSLLVSKMKKAAESSGQEIDIRATAESGFSEYENKTDILLLGPQVGYMVKKLKEKYEPKGMKVAVINSIDYGMMNGEKVLKEALSM
jgi:Phosphotransferase system cellobiose-specific component IIB